MLAAELEVVAGVQVHVHPRREARAHQRAELAADLGGIGVDRRDELREGRIANRAPGREGLPPGGGGDRPP